jgi:hypothetical protein
MKAHRRNNREQTKSASASLSFADVLVCSGFIRELRSRGDNNTNFTQTEESTMTTVTVALNSRV